MSVDAGSVYSSIRIRLTDLDNDLKGVYARLGQLEQNITKTTVPAQKNFKDMFAAVVTGQAALGLAQKGFDALTGFIKDSTQVARESQEMISKYDVVFSGMGDASEEAAKKFSDSFDLAGATSKEMLANTGNLLQGMGATKEESLALSLEVNTLASDLASFTNNQGGSRAASEALTKALLGEKESMKTLGIAILDSDVNARVAKNGQDNLTGTALKLAKAQATLQLITEQSKNAIGDYARTADSAANTQKRAEESTKKLQIALGTALNPAATLMASVWAKVSSALADTIDKQNKLAEARKDSDKGVATYDQRILLLKDEIAYGDDLLKQYGETRETAKKSNNDVVKSIVEQIAATQQRIDGIERAKQTQALADRTKAEADKKAAAEAARLAALEEERAKREKARSEAEATYKQAIAKANIDNANGITTIEEKTNSLKEASRAYYDELTKIGFTINTEIGSKGQSALVSMTSQLKNWGKEVEVTKVATEGFTDPLLAGMQKYKDANADITKEVEALTNVQKDDTQEAIKAFNAKSDAAVKNGEISKEQSDKLKKSVEEYYNSLRDKKASQEFIANVTSLMNAGMQVFTALQALVSQVVENIKEDELDALETETKAREKAFDERSKLLNDALKEEQDAATERAKKTEAALDHENQLKERSDDRSISQELKKQDEAISKKQKLDKEYLDDKYKALRKALDKEQKEQQKALDEKYQSTYDELDAELQAKLYASGLAGAATVDQYAQELAAAIATGDATKIKDAQDAYDKAVLEQQYADQKKALQEKQAEDTLALQAQQDAASLALDAAKKAEEDAAEAANKAAADKLENDRYNARVALEEQRYQEGLRRQDEKDKAAALLANQQAADKTALEKKLADEKTRIDEDQQRKKAKIEYDANMITWGMQLASTTAQAAMAVLNATSSAMSLGPGALVALPVYTSLATAAGALSIAAVAAAQPKLKYATGGVVPGSSYTGDNMIAGLNSGERVLTASQNAAMYDMMMKYMNGESGSKGNTVIQLGTVIASPSGLRELNRLLAQYGTVEKKRVGTR